MIVRQSGRAERGARVRQRLPHMDTSSRVSFFQRVLAALFALVTAVGWLALFAGWADLIGNGLARWRLLP